MAKNDPQSGIEIVRRCSICGIEVERYLAKQESLFLSSYGTIDCPNCKMETPELRDAAGRVAALENELRTLPTSNT